MLLDKLNIFSEAQTVTTGSSSGIASTNVIDLNSARDIGVGENLYLVVTVDTSLSDTGNNSTLAVHTQTDDNESFNTPTNTALITTFAVNTAAKTTVIKRVDPGMFNEQYGRVHYLSDNGDLATGAVSAFLTHDPDIIRQYPDAITIS